MLLEPEVFDQRDEDGIVSLLETHPPERLHPTVHEAASVCPTAAIALSESE